MRTTLFFSLAAFLFLSISKIFAILGTLFRTSVSVWTRRQTLSISLNLCRNRRSLARRKMFLTSCSTLLLHISYLYSSLISEIRTNRKNQNKKKIIRNNFISKKLSYLSIVSSKTNFGRSIGFLKYSFSNFLSC